MGRFHRALRRSHADGPSQERLETDSVPLECDEGVGGEMTYDDKLWQRFFSAKKVLVCVQKNKRTLTILP